MKDVTFCDNSTMETIVKNPENKENGQNQPPGHMWTNSSHLHCIFFGHCTEWPRIYWRVNTYNLKAFISKFEGHLVYVKRHGLSAFGLGFSSSRQILTLPFIHIRLRWIQMRDRKGFFFTSICIQEGKREMFEWRRENAEREGYSERKTERI